MIGQKNYRRIDFRPPTKPSNGFQNSQIVGKSPEETSSLKSTGSKNVTNAKKTVQDDPVAGPVPGLFDPKLVAQYMNWKTINRVGPGLFNHGNSCYLNSTLQCLLHTPALIQILLKETDAALRGLNRSGDNPQMKVIQLFQRYASF
jgi:ubiquitin C-terminal hydrolase